MDISAPSTRSSRRVSLTAATAVSDFVPFFLSPDATLWQRMRSGEEDPRLSSEVRQFSVTDFVILVSSYAQLRSTTSSDAPQTVLADGDAAATLTRFGLTASDAERVLRRLQAERASETAAILEAELLVWRSVPLSAVTLIGVANDRIRSTLKSTLAGSGLSPRIVVHPPWFAAKLPSLGHA